MNRLPLLLILVALGCPKKAPELVPAPPEAVPLDRALALMERDRASLTLPRGEEARYTIPTRYGVIDAVLADPLSLPSLGESLGAALDQANTPAEILAALQPVAPARSGAPAAQTTAPVRHRAGIELPSEMVASPRWAVRTQHLPAPWPEAIAELALLIEELDAASPSWDTRGTGPTRPNRAAEEFFIDVETGEYRVMAHPVGVQLEFLRHADTLDLGAMQAAAGRLLAAARAWTPRLTATVGSLPTTDGPLLQLETGLGRIIVGSPGRDSYGAPAVLVIDPGGDDSWVSNAGSNAGLPARVALALDLGGNDVYDSPTPHSQGSGFLGIGVLIDEAGDDRYSAPTHCQGTGFMGVGILWDSAGNDTYAAEGFAQGAATFGVGLLVDVAGTDSASAGSRAQGFASTGGLGALIDLAGDDMRRVGVPGAPAFGPTGGGGQGAAFGTRPFPWDRDIALHGGVGLLYDRAGNDTYFGRAFTQGAAWFASLGLLLERAGDDRYTAELFGQGAAAHLAAGLAQDAAGRDTWSGIDRVQGAAADRSVGILDDRGPEADGYRLGPTGPSNAAGPFSGQALVRQARALAILVDAGGDDIHQVDGDALGTGVAAGRPDLDGLAILLDLGGNDAYESKRLAPGTNPTDGATWFSGLIGIGMDLDLPGAGYLPSPGWSPWVAPAEPGFSWDGRDTPTRWEPEPDGAPDGEPLDRWRWANGRAAAWSAEPPPADDPQWARAVDMAMDDRDPRVQRAAGLALAAAGDPRGIDALISTLSFRSADNDPSAPGGSIVATLQALTGQLIELDPRDWRLWWSGARQGFDLASRLPAWRLLERARRAGELGDFLELLRFVDLGARASAGDRILLDRFGALVGSWAAVMVDPECPALHDPALAAELAQRAVRWAPDSSARDFVTLGSAFLQLGERDLAKRASDKALLSDPDGVAVGALRRALGLERKAPPAGSE